MFQRTSFSLFLTVMLAASGVASEPVAPVERGYHWIRTRGYLPADFDQQIFDQLWTSWPDEQRAAAKKSDLSTRRRLTRTFYGMMPNPKALHGPGLGYVDDGRGGWVMNCLSCHAGKVAGQVIPGLGNTHLNLQTLVEDVRRTKLKLLKPLSHLGLVSAKLPLGVSRGTTNSVVFGIVLGNYRDADMGVHLDAPAPARLLHHGMDAPPLWNVRHKSQLYCDGFAPKNHRVLMQFMLLPTNGPDTLKNWEPAFQDILAWIESLEPPVYPWAIQRPRAQQGRVIFNQHCARCHGTYGQARRYPERTVPLKTIGTDSLRLRALTTRHRRWIKDGWMSRYGKDPTRIRPTGYVAPPLDGIWATAPYFHNGSVPTLWHVLHPAQRPSVWSRSENGYDRARIGLDVQEFESLPPEAESPRTRRDFYDTSRPGSSAGGHLFPDTLTAEQKRAVLEYLKTL